MAETLDVRGWVDWRKVEAAQAFERRCVQCGATRQAGERWNIWCYSCNPHRKSYKHRVSPRLIEMAEKVLASIPPKEEPVIDKQDTPNEGQPTVGQEVWPDDPDKAARLDRALRWAVDTAVKLALEARDREKQTKNDTKREEEQGGSNSKAGG